MAKMNLEKFFDNYSENLQKVSILQRKLLDEFRDKEEELKNYVKEISFLEKVKNNYKMKNFTNIVSNIVYNLGEEFSNLNIPLKDIPIEKNTKKIKEIIFGIENKGYEFKNISNRFNNIKKMWEAFINPRDYLDKNSVFYKTIQEEMLELEEEIKKSDIDDIGIVEEKIASVKDLIEKTIYAISELEILYNKNFFVGYEASQLKKEIELFLEYKYKDKKIGELVLFTKEILSKKKKISSKNKTITERINVVLIKEKSSKKVFTYGIYINGVYLNPSEIVFKEPEYNFLDKYIYLDNYPIEGIFKKEWLIENLTISQNQLAAMEKFNKITIKNFLINVVGGSILFWFIYLIVPFFTLIPFTSSIIGLHFYFAWNFKRLKRKIDKEFGVPNAFYFFQSNFLYVKEGTDDFKYEKIPYLIIENFEKIFNLTEREGE